MADINLLPEDKQPLGSFLSWVLTSGRYIVIGTEIIVLIAFLSRFKLDRDLTDLHQSIAQKQAIVLAAQDLEKQVRILQNHLLIIKKFENQRDFPPKLLATFEQLIPIDVSLTELSSQEAELTLKATAGSNQGFSAFINNLSSSPSFKDISLDNVGKNETGAIEFQITTTLVN